MHKVRVKYISQEGKTSWGDWRPLAIGIHPDKIAGAIMRMGCCVVAVQVECENQTFTYTLQSLTQLRRYNHTLDRSAVTLIGA